MTDPADGPRAKLKRTRGKQTSAGASGGLRRRAGRPVGPLVSSEELRATLAPAAAHTRERPMLDRLPFAKPVRYVDPTLLRDYVRLHAECEVDGCRRRPAPEPHHLKPRAHGRDDRPDNLLRLCGLHHREAHLLGGSRWFAAYRDRLLPAAQTKVARALGLTDVDS